MTMKTVILNVALFLVLSVLPLAAQGIPAPAVNPSSYRIGLQDEIRSRSSTSRIFGDIADADGAISFRWSATSMPPV